ncbi:acyl-CoA synthetase family member 2, mitochondrial isoform X2 [Vombatus ursinus]|uniref:Medium-chain acyl-CoA ligase ACSF2, mitochondrial n=1 Tax=Vombatus ursinus TaxID=29139 RepID=A0A4X2LRN1_VOMUR|nr:acyl-CoA synthetase family member 2, mitochondrial isoform X2 [Vombatus ursinus]
MAVSFGVRRLGRLPAGVMGVLGVRSALVPVRGWRRAEFQGIRLLSSTDVRSHISSSTGKLSYLKGPTNIKLSSKTVGQCLDDIAQRFPDREAIVVSYQNIRKTFAQFKQEVDVAALGLLSLGLSKGDRLGMWGPNSYEWVLMQLATAQAGIILISVNPAYKSQELKFVLKKVGCKALVFPAKFKTQDYYNILKEICPELETCSPGALRSKNLPDLTTVIILDSKLPGALHMNDVLQAGKVAQLAQLRDIQRSLSCHDPINIQFTSGTTGSPKGATLSHYNIVNNAALIGDRMNLLNKVAYGTTENSPVTFMHSYDDSIERKTFTVGRIMPHTEAQVMDPQTKKQLEINMPGELCIRGYCVMMGYWDDPKKTEDIIDEHKWYWTGDIASVDEEGYCKIVGRSKDMIIRGGENIYPAELEDFFHKHPCVQEAQVVGVKDKRMGEEICACIRLKPEAEEQVTPEELQAYCRGKISHFKIPRYIVFVKEYPLTVSGKIQKYKLREWMEKDLNL